MEIWIWNIPVFLLPDTVAVQFEFFKGILKDEGGLIREEWFVYLTL